jgi:hypothetical protein
VWSCRAIGSSASRACRWGCASARRSSSWCPATPPDAHWTTEVRVREIDHGYDFTGPAVTGRRGDRAVKLAWLDGGGELFRAAKLRLDGVPAATVAEVLRTEGALVATVRLTDGRGGPTCASVPESLITWTAKP